MFYSIYRVLLILGDLMLLAALLLADQQFVPAFWAGFFRGCAPALLLGALYFLHRARQSGDPRARCAAGCKKPARPAQRKGR